MSGTPLSHLKGIGPKSRFWLHEMGINTVEEIESLGVVEVYKRLKIAFPNEVTLNMLYGLHAALLKIHWKAITPEMKAELQRALEND